MSIIIALAQQMPDKTNKLLRLIVVLCTTSTAAADTSLGGHVKYFYTYTNFPSDSAYTAIGDPYTESLGNLRIKARHKDGQWDAQIHYVLNGLYSRDLSDCVIRGGLVGNGCAQLASDRRQLLDMSSVIKESDTSVVFQRIDRLVVSYAGKSMAIRVGRQAISWGNGMVYNPLDLFNPFPPDAIDTEYKSGDDMLYMQGLFDNGSDLQALYIPRRDLSTGEIASNQSAAAGKYHWLGANYELDFLAAINYGDEIIGAAYTGEWNENVINASISLTNTDDGNTLSAAVNYNYSAIVTERNISGFIELFYNGFGLSGDRHSIQDVIDQPDLFKRLTRGELFTIGRYYLASGIVIEMTPLLNLNPVLFINLGDSSALLQFLGTYSLRQDLDLLAGFNLPAGAEGTEFGGITADNADNEFLAPGNSLFARLAWYF